MWGEAWMSVAGSEKWKMKEENSSISEIRYFSLTPISTYKKCGLFYFLLPLPCQAIHPFTLPCTHPIIYQFRLLHRLEMVIESAFVNYVTRWLIEWVEWWQRPALHVMLCKQFCDEASWKCQDEGGVTSLSTGPRFRSCNFCMHVKLAEKGSRWGEKHFHWKTVKMLKAIRFVSRVERARNWKF